MIRVRFLGTAAARPTVSRNVAGIAVQREGQSFLWDCGEGTQRQIMRFGTGFSFRHVFITHAHADHFLGLPGLLRTMGLQGREEPLFIYGPKGSEAVLSQAVHLGVKATPFPVEVLPLQGGGVVDFGDWRVEAFPVSHGIPALGYALVERARLGRFDVNRARELGVPEGPMFGRLHRGETVEIDGRQVRPEDLVGPPRPGRRLVYAGDCRPGATTAEAARGADLLIHEATFTAEEEDRARETRHSTAAEAADVARQAEVRSLAMTHISARYGELPKVLEAEARAVFKESRVAFDGLELEIPYRVGAE
ncbi:MAG: ribonuclease Z [Gemmatimonadetes bacterium]|nr:ribonuclease Z [Gemmatimonadota bacterium]